MNLQVLESIGFSPSESKAYVSCLELGPSTANEISEHAVLNRSNCYQALKRLILKGVLSTIERDGKTIFESAKPKQLFKLYKSKEEDVQQLVTQLEKIPVLPMRQFHTATVFEGYKGIKSVFEDILDTLNKGDKYFVFGAVDIPKPFERYVIHWTKRRVSKKIKLNILYHEEAKRFIEQTKHLPLTTIKVLPKTYITPAAVNIYGDTTATIVWTEQPIAFVVKNKEYTDSFRNYFNMLWQIAKK